MSLPGSSPHTRGARRAQRRRDHPRRIIPAYAGSTVWGVGAGCWTWDHPRIRGEHIGDADDGPRLSGSSPHTRGAPSAPRHTTRTAGIIPAYAGSTSTPALPTGSPRDHPRIRGEHRLRPRVVHAQKGSSPHTRGALEPVGGHVDVAGIIPAYAGSTRPCDADRRRFADHPRIRGEHQVLTVPGDALEGSSPHTRGAPIRR